MTQGRTGSLEGSRSSTGLHSTGFIRAGGTELVDAADTSPSRASLYGLDGINFFNAATLAAFGPYVAVYLAEQNWTQQDIGFVLTASGLAGLLALMPGGGLLDAVRRKRALIALGASLVAVSALVIGIWSNFPVVLAALVMHGTTGAFLGPAITAISLGLSVIRPCPNSWVAISASLRWAH